MSCVAGAWINSWNSPGEHAAGGRLLFELLGRDASCLDPNARRLPSLCQSGFSPACFSWRDGLVKESSLWPGLDGFTCSACVQVVSKVYADLDSQIRQERAGSRKIWWSRGSHVEASLL